MTSFITDSDSTLFAILELMWGMSGGQVLVVVIWIFCCLFHAFYWIILFNFLLNLKRPLYFFSFFLSLIFFCPYFLPFFISFQISPFFFYFYAFLSIIFYNLEWVLQRYFFLNWKKPTMKVTRFRFAVKGDWISSFPF